MMLTTRILVILFATKSARMMTVKNSGSSNVQNEVFDNTELWNLDITFAKFLVPRLKAAKESYALEEEVMDKIIFAFEYASSDQLFHGDMPKEVTEGLQLFTDNYFRLWN